MNKNTGGGTMEAALKRMFKTLDEKVKPEHTAVLVIDMQNDFCEVGGMFHKEGYDVSGAKEITPRILNLVEKAREYGTSVIFVKNVSNAKCNYLSDVWLEQNIRMWKGKRYIEYPVCEEGSWGSEFCKGFEPREKDFVVIKNRYSAFEGTNLELILKSNGIRTLIVTGVATNVCVESTIRQGYLKDYYIVAPEDCISSLNKEMHEASLFSIDKWFGHVLNSDEVVECWEKVENKGE